MIKHRFYINTRTEKQEEIEFFISLPYRINQDDRISFEFIKDELQKIGIDVYELFKHEINENELKLEEAQEKDEYIESAEFDISEPSISIKKDGLIEIILDFGYDLGPRYFEEDSL